MFYLRAEGLFCILDVLSGGLGIGSVNCKLNFFCCIYIFSIFHQNPRSGSVFSLKCQIQIRIRIKLIRIRNTANNCNNLSYLPLNPSDLSEYGMEACSGKGGGWSQITTGKR
jgi:hypothetical protein